ncbi:MAG: hypothetical protein JW776_08310 [Candidatus Lokiarchaeota archaeon]|nr:hypothetical protein [Candidatus Lokiarchaeota archaeon]
MVHKLFYLNFSIIVFCVCAPYTLPQFASIEQYPNPSIISTSIIADHTIINQVRLDLINSTKVQYAKDILHVGYFHTSHGSQLTGNRGEMIEFKGELYNWTENGDGNSLDLDDYCFDGDLGNPDWTTWKNRARIYLNDNPDVNVLMGSWCGQVSSASESNIDTYLSLMSELEIDYPNVTFVYMTGHVDGTGLTGNLHIRNEQIRSYCSSNNRVLFDFADIESYDPDGKYFGDKNVQDDCDYDGGNWAIEWQNSHTEGLDWFSCPSAHSQPLNANMKTYAMWWMFTMIAQESTENPQGPEEPRLVNLELWIYIGIGIGVFLVIGVPLAIFLKKKKL